VELLLAVTSATNVLADQSQHLTQCGRCIFTKLQSCLLYNYLHATRLNNLASSIKQTSWQQPSEPQRPHSCWRRCARTQAPLCTHAAEAPRIAACDAVTQSDPGTRTTPAPGHRPTASAHCRRAAICATHAHSQCTSSRHHTATAALAASGSVGARTTQPPATWYLRSSAASMSSVIASR
jgi:hypothetical protein